MPLEDENSTTLASCRHPYLLTVYYVVTNTSQKVLESGPWVECHQGILLLQHGSSLFTVPGKTRIRGKDRTEDATEGLIKYGVTFNSTAPSP